MAGTQDIATTQATQASRIIDTILKYFSNKKSPAENILLELGKVRKSVSRELAFFNNPLVDEATKKKRLNFLFVKDLLDGVNGMILNHKDRRDNESIAQVPLSYKILASLFLFLSSFGMLYYVFLFAMQQTASRQSAWFNSFQVWLAFEIFISSTGIVLIEHVLVPLLCLKDVQRVKEKIVSDILIFQKRLKDESRRRAITKALHTSTSSDQNNIATASTSTTNASTFNAAEFLYPSHRIARMFPKYSESELILQYRTIWPKTSFQQNGETKSIKKKYDKRFAFLTSTITRVGMFTLTSVIQLPPSCQDMGIQMVILTTFGYLLKLHVDLFEIYPLLAFLPTFLVALLVHTMASGAKPRNLSMTYPLTSEPGEEEKKEAEEKKETEKETKGGQILAQASNDPEAKERDEEDEGEAEDHLSPLNQPPRRGVAPRSSYRDLLLVKEQLEIFRLELEDEEPEGGQLSPSLWFTPSSESSASSSSSSEEGIWESSSSSGSYKANESSAEGIVWEEESAENVSHGSGRGLSSFSPNVFSDSGSLHWESTSD
jgi:hypothetical protein